MVSSRRVRRLKRGSGLSKRMPSFNLVSLMDIFTILVFFLLVNSSNTQELPSANQIKLPVSVSERRPEITAIVLVTKTEILVQGTPVANIEEVIESESISIPGVITELRYIASKAVGISKATERKKKEVTIMGDAVIPFKIMKKIMNSCTMSGYDTIYLAVVQAASQFKKTE